MLFHLIALHQFTAPSRAVKYCTENRNRCHTLLYGRLLAARSLVQSSTSDRKASSRRVFFRKQISVQKTVTAAIPHCRGGHWPPASLPISPISDRKSSFRRSFSHSKIPHRKPAPPYSIARPCNAVFRLIALRQFTASSQIGSAAKNIHNIP